MCLYLGAHNLENAFAAVVLCHRMGVELEVLSKALGSFKGIERRLENVGTVGGRDCLR